MRGGAAVKDVDDTRRAARGVQIDALD